MKKIFAFIVILLAAKVSFGQIVQTRPSGMIYQGVGNTSTWYQVGGVLYPVLGVASGSWADTAAMNLNPFIKNIPGFQARTANRYWVRSDDALKWNEYAFIGGSGVGTVTNVSALTLGTTGTDLSSTVANSTTTPVITLNVPTASALNRGALSAADWITFNSKGVGTVTSVGLSLPSIFTVSGSPVTGSGTLTGTFNTQTANTFFGGPSSGGAATPTFRAIVAGDLPSLSPYTLQQVLTAGSTLNQNNTIAGGGFNFNFYEFKGLELATSQPGGYMYFNTRASVLSNRFAQVDQDSSRWISTVTANLNSTYINQTINEIELEAPLVKIETAQFQIENGSEGSGKVLTSNATGIGTWTTPSTVATAVPLSGITAATGTNTINSGTLAQEWQWNTLAGNTGMKFSSTSTAAASNLQRLVEISLSGANATASQTTTTLYVTNAHSGTTNINNAIYAANTNDGSTSSAITGVGVTGVGVSGASTDQSGVSGTSVNQTGVYGSSAASYAAYFLRSSGANSSVSGILKLLTTPVGTAANGFGESIDFLLHSDNSNARTSNQIISKWTTAADATRTSQLIITGVNSAVTGDIATFSGNGAVAIPGVLTIGNSSVLATPASLTLTNATGLPPTTGIVGWPTNAAGALTNDGSGNYSWAASGSSTWNGIANPTGDQALTFDAGESSTWTNANTTEDLMTINSSTMTTSSQLSVVSTSTALAAGNNLAEFLMSGANGSSSITATGVSVSVTNTGTTGTNVGINVTASGATNNYAALLTGSVGINQTTPLTALDLGAANTTNSQFKVNRMEMQSYGTSDNFISNNVYINGGFVARATGVSQMIYFSGADIVFYSGASVSAGAAVSPIDRLHIAGATGNIGLTVVNPTARLHIQAGSATASTAPLKFTSGTNLTTAEAGAAEYDGKDLFFTPAGTIRKVIPTVISSRSVAQSAAVASVAVQTVGASDASYFISANVLVTTSSAEAFTVTVAYTDESNTARTQTMPFILLAGTTVAAINFANGAAPYEGLAAQIRCKASTTITVATTGTFTGCTYNVEGTITKIQ